MTRGQGDPASAPPASHRDSVLSVYSTALLQGALGVVFPASSALLRERLLLSDTLYGALYLPGLILAIITSLMGHALLRRWSLKTLFVFALVSQTVTLVLIALSGLLGRTYGLPSLILGLIVSGPAGGAMGITLNTAAIELFPHRKSGALSALHGVLGAGAALGPVLVAAFISLGHWAIAPLILAAGMIAMVLISTKRPVIGLTETLEEKHGRSDVPPRLVLRSLTGFLYCMGEATFAAWAVLFLRENRGLPMGVAAASLSAFWLAMTVGRLGGAVLVRWISPLRLGLILALGMAGSFLLVADARGPIDSLLRFAAAGLGCSALFPLLMSLASGEFPDRTPQVSAVFTGIAMVGIGVGCFAVGPLRGPLGLERIFRFSSVGPILLMLLMLALRFGRGGPSARQSA
jgi:MFS transporter, FHS family, glucose/mannose:H+ symporter